MSLTLTDPNARPIASTKASLVRAPSFLQLPPKTLTPSQNASKSVQIADRSASQQNMYEEDHLRLPPSTGSIIVTTAVGQEKVENCDGIKGPIRVLVADDHSLF